MTGSSPTGGSDPSLTDPNIVVDYMARYSEAILIYLEYLINERQIQVEIRSCLLLFFRGIVK